MTMENPDPLCGTVPEGTEGAQIQHVPARPETLSPTVEPLTPSDRSQASPVKKADFQIKQEDQLLLPTPPPSSLATSISPSSTDGSLTVAKVVSLEQQLSDLDSKVTNATKVLVDQNTRLSDLTVQHKVLKSSLGDETETRKRLLAEKRKLETKIKENREKVQQFTKDCENKSEEFNTQKRAKFDALRILQTLRSEKEEVQLALRDAVYDRDIVERFTDKVVRDLARQLGWNKEDDEVDFARNGDKAWILMAKKLAGGAKDIEIADFAMIEDGMQRAVSQSTEKKNMKSSKSKLSVSSSQRDDEMAVKAGTEEGAGSSSASELTINDVEEGFRKLREAQEGVAKMVQIMKGSKRKRLVQEEEESLEKSPPPPVRRVKSKRSENARAHLEGWRQSIHGMRGARPQRRPLSGADYYEQASYSENEELRPNHAGANNDQSDVDSDEDERSSEADMDESDDADEEDGSSGGSCQDESDHDYED